VKGGGEGVRVWREFEGWLFEILGCLVVVAGIALFVLSLVEVVEAGWSSVALGFMFLAMAVIVGGAGMALVQRWASLVLVIGMATATLLATHTVNWLSIGVAVALAILAVLSAVVTRRHPRRRSVAGVV
jgi:hypothetical protein